MSSYDSDESLEESRNTSYDISENTDSDDDELFAHEMPAEPIDNVDTEKDEEELPELVVVSSSMPSTIEESEPQVQDVESTADNSLSSEMTASENIDDEVVDRESTADDTSVDLPDKWDKIVEDEGVDADMVGLAEPGEVKEDVAVLSTKDLIQQYNNNKIDIKPYTEDSPRLLFIVDNSPTSDGSYDTAISNIQKWNDLHKGKEVHYFRFYSLKKFERFMAKNYDAIHTYVPHSEEIRLITCPSCVRSAKARKVDDQPYKGSIVALVRDSYHLSHSPIAIYYWRNRNYEAFRNEADDIYVTDNAQFIDLFAPFLPLANIKGFLK